MTDTLLSALLLMFSLGFMGSLHCIGMCGGLVTAVSMSRPKVWWSGLLIYQLGRVSTYALLGLLVGFTGVALSSFGGEILQRSLAIFAGTLMIIFALNLAGWLPDPLRRFSAWANKKTGLAKLVQKASTHARAGSWYTLGLANGLLPCGLVYAALSLALASNSAHTATLMMIVFGLGTIPAMLFVPSLLHKMTPDLRKKSMYIAALIMIAIGIITIFRSTVHQHHMSMLLNISFV